MGNNLVINKLRHENSLFNNPNRTRSQITFFDEPVNNGLVCPSKDYNGFLFTKDTGGNEFSQIYWYDLDSRTSEMLSDGSSVNGGVVWSNKGDKFAFTSTRRNKKDFDVYVSNMSTPKEASLLIKRGSGRWGATDWSPDDNQLIIIQYLSSTQSNSFTLDLNSNDLVQINEGKTEAVFLARAWDRTGTKIYATTNEGKEFNTLVEYDINKKTHKNITEGISWNIEGFVTNSNRTKAAFTANENGFNQLYLLDLESMEYEKVPNLPVGQIYSLKFHTERDEIGLVLNTTETPGDVYSIDINSLDITRWTTSEVGGLNTSSFPEPELISYETFDEVDGKKRQIPAFVYKPRRKVDNLPVMISIHGGPEGQHRPSFSFMHAFLANK